MRAEEYEQAIKLAPNEPELYEGLGWEYRLVGHADLAAKAFEQQLKLTPGNPIAMYNLGSAMVDSGQEQAAIPLLEQVVHIYNHPTGADYYLGRALAAEGRHEEAVRELLRGTLLTGEMQLRAWYELSQEYRRLGKNGRGARCIGQVPIPQTDRRPRKGQGAGRLAKDKRFGCRFSGDKSKLTSHRSIMVQLDYSVIMVRWVKLG